MRSKTMKGQKDIREVVIPNEFTGIGFKPFSGFSSLTNILFQKVW